MKELAPILLFTYKRLEPLKLTIKALQSNYLAAESHLYIFSDGPKVEEDTHQIKQIRDYLKSINGFKKISIFESEANLGLANSIISGVSRLISQHKNVIVLEDDLITSKNFLSYMNSSLLKYECIKDVFSISGYSFDLGYNLDNNEDAYFLNRGWSWGWATWQDRWKEIDWQVKDYNDFIKDKKAQKRFAKGGSDLNKMLDKQMKGNLDSWAIRWFYHQFKVNGLTLFPVDSKVLNNGFDEFATHTNGSNNRYIPNLDTNNSNEFILPRDAVINDFYQRRFCKKMNLFSRLKSKIESIIKTILR